MNLGLRGKNVVITGGTKGIGLAISESFLKEGASVHVISRNADHGLKSVLQNKARFYVCDVTKEDEFLKTFSEIQKNTHNKIDIVIANVGNGNSPAKPINEDVDWNSSWDTNFKSALNTARIFAPSLVESGGSLLFISSIAGMEYIGAPTDYSTAKSALLAFAKTLSHKLAPSVRVNVVAPGNIFFEHGTWDKKMKENKEGVVKMLNDKVPLNRLGLPDEVADLVLFLSSEKAAFITGACFVIDGGQTTGF